jgi:hypothetical protein
MDSEFNLIRNYNHNCNANPRLLIVREFAPRELQASGRASSAPRDHRAEVRALHIGEDHADLIQDGTELRVVGRSSFEPLPRFRSYWCVPGKPPCHRADAVVIKARIAQHPVRSRKALAEHMGEDEAATSARRQDASCELLMWR